MTTAPTPLPLYRSATTLVRRNFWFVASIAVIELTAHLVIEATAFMDAANLLVLGLWLWMWVAYSGYISLASDDRLTAADILSRKTHPNLRFLAASLLGATILICLILLPLIGLNGAIDPTIGVVIVFLVPGAVYLALLSQFGLIFPAAALEKKFRLKWAFHAVRPYWLRLLLDLGRGVIFCNLLLLAVYWVTGSFGLQTDPIANDGSVSLSGCVAVLIGSILGSWTIYLSVVALANAYRSATIRPDLSRVFE